jgi:hypothetical protein
VWSGGELALGYRTWLVWDVLCVGLIGSALSSLANSRSCLEPQSSAGGSKGRLKGRQSKLTLKQQKELRRMHGTGDYTIRATSPNCSKCPGPPSIAPSVAKAHVANAIDTPARFSASCCSDNRTHACDPRCALPIRNVPSHSVNPALSAANPRRRRLKLAMTMRSSV